MSKRRSYSWDFKAEVLAVYEVDGPAAAARLFKVPRCTIQRWAKAAAVDTSSETKKTTEAAIDSLRARRLRIRDKLAEHAESMLDRLSESYTIVAGKEAVVIELERPPAGVCKDLATTAAILIDKLRLEAGEVTSRDEHLHDFSRMSDDELRAVIAAAEDITRGAV